MLCNNEAGENRNFIIRLKGLKTQKYCNIRLTRNSHSSIECIFGVNSNTEYQVLLSFGNEITGSYHKNELKDWNLKQIAKFIEEFFYLHQVKEDLFEVVHIDQL